MENIDLQTFLTRKKLPTFAILHVLDCFCKVFDFFDFLHFLDFAKWIFCRNFVIRVNGTKERERDEGQCE